MQRRLGGVAVAAAKRGRVAVALMSLFVGVVAEVMVGRRRVGDGALAADVGGEGLQGGPAGAGAGLGA
jgi:hypothetical protein